jgi:hypothetical protein
MMPSEKLNGDLPGISINSLALRLRRNSNRLFIASAIFLAVFGILFLLGGDELFSILGLFGLRIYPPLAGMILVLLGTGLGLFAYLMDGSPRQQFDTALESRLIEGIKDLAGKIQGYHLQNEKIVAVASGFSDKDRQELIKSLQENMAEKLSQVTIAEISEKPSLVMDLPDNIKRVRELIEQTANRLKLEVENLTKRSNINLVIGVITSLSAVILLIYMVLIAVFTRTNRHSHNEQTSLQYLRERSFPGLLPRRG